MLNKEVGRVGENLSFIKEFKSILLEFGIVI